jgi:4'-phosphopantetheinyl transferase
VRVATVDLWRLRSDQGRFEDDRLWDCLHPDERARASRFHFRRDRDRFVAFRGSLRHILARYLGQPPEGIRLGYTSAGKPFLRDHPDLHFNLSHAADLALVVVSHDGPLGVDIEEMQSNSVVDSTSGLVLSHPEHDELRLLSGPSRCERFARFWTRKEAYIKADGRGMQLQLDRIDVATSLDRVLLREQGSNRWMSCPRWTLRAIPVDPGYAAAVAAEGSDWQVVSCGWLGTVPESLTSRPVDQRIRMPWDGEA